MWCKGVSCLLVCTPHIYNKLYFGSETPGGIHMRMRSAHVTGTSSALLTGSRRVNTELRGFGRTVELSWLELFPPLSRDIWAGPSSR